MNHLKKLFSPFIVASLLLIGATSVKADSSMHYGEYIIHYNTIPTTFLDRKIASAYNIKRSKNKAMINIAIIKRKQGTTGTAVTGMVQAYNSNLNNQLHQIDLRKVSENSGKAIYYIGEFNVSNNETLNFNLTVSPEHKNPPATIRFTKNFFTE